MEGSNKVPWQVRVFPVLALEGGEEKTTTSTLCSLVFFLMLCTGKNICRFQRMES